MAKLDFISSFVGGSGIASAWPKPVRGGIANILFNAPGTQQVVPAPAIGFIRTFHLGEMANCLPSYKCDGDTVVRYYMNGALVGEETLLAGDGNGGIYILPFINGEVGLQIEVVSMLGTFFRFLSAYVDIPFANAQSSSFDLSDANQDLLPFAPVGKAYAYCLPLLSFGGPIIVFNPDTVDHNIIIEKFDGANSFQVGSYFAAAGELAATTNNGLESTENVKVRIRLGEPVVTDAPKALFLYRELNAA